MLVDEDQVLATLRERFGHETFRPGQEEVVRAVLDGRDALVVLPTGAGKSLVYQLPAVILEGLTVVVSPLIALMKDQTDKLDRVGVEALTINSGLTGGEKRAAERAVAAGGGEILYVTPERFRIAPEYDRFYLRNQRLRLLVALPEDQPVADGQSDHHQHQRRHHGLDFSPGNQQPIPKATQRSYKQGSHNALPQGRTGGILDQLFGTD